jgi:hypothetical protein
VLKGALMRRSGAIAAAARGAAFRGDERIGGREPHPRPMDGEQLLNLLRSAREPRPGSIWLVPIARGCVKTSAQRQLLDAYETASSPSATDADKRAFESALHQRRLANGSSVVDVLHRPLAKSPSGSVEELLGHLQAGRMPLDADYGLAHVALSRVGLAPEQSNLLHEFVKTTALGHSDAAIVSAGEAFMRDRQAPDVPADAAVDWRLLQVRAQGLVNTLMLGRMPMNIDREAINAAAKLDLPRRERDLVSAYTLAVRTDPTQESIDKFNNQLSLQAAIASGARVTDAASPAPEPHDLARAVLAFQRMVSDPSLLPAATHRGPRFSLPLAGSADAARLLYRSIASGAAAAGDAPFPEDVRRLSAHARHVDAHLEAIAKANRLDAHSLSLLCAAAPRVRATIETLTALGNIAPMSNRLLIEMLSLPAESCRPGVAPNREALTPIAQLVTPFYGKTAPAVFKPGGAYEGQLKVIEGAERAGVINDGQRDVLTGMLQACRNEILG